GPGPGGDAAHAEGDDLAAGLGCVLDAPGQGGGVEVDDRVRDADGDDLGEGGAAEVVVEAGVGDGDAAAGEECEGGGPVAGVAAGEVPAGVGGVVGVAVHEVALEVGAQEERQGGVGGVVAGVEDGDADPAAVAGVAEAVAGRLEAGVAGVEVPAE